MWMYIWSFKITSGIGLPKHQQHPGVCSMTISLKILVLLVFHAFEAAPLHSLMYTQVVSMYVNLLYVCWVLKIQANGFALMENNRCFTVLHYNIDVFACEFACVIQSNGD